MGGGKGEPSLSPSSRPIIYPFPRQPISDPPPPTPFLDTPSSKNTPNEPLFPHTISRPLRVDARSVRREGGQMMIARTERSMGGLLGLGMPDVLDGLGITELSRPAYDSFPRLVRYLPFIWLYDAAEYSRRL